MRRGLSLVGASLVVYACALVLGTLVICGTGHASEVVGEWALLEDFRDDAMEGRIYNPDNGRTYRAALKLRSPDILEVKGCVLIVCDTQVWRRVESLCGTLPRQTHGAGTAANRGMQ